MDMLRRVVVLTPVAVLAATLAAAQAPPAAGDSLRVRMLRAEDARAQTEAELAALRQGLTHADPRLRVQAVRAIGRLERPALIRDLTRPLADASPDVRMAAADAVGQSARGAQGLADAKSRLLTRAKIEQDPRVWGVVAATLGRLPYSDARDVDAVEAILAAVLPGASSTSIQIDALLGATEGLEALARVSGKVSKLKATTLDGLRAASALQGRAEDADKLARIRRLATLALTASGAVTRPGLDAGAADRDEEVRRLTMVAARTAIDGRENVLEKGLGDSSPRVRYEALQSWGRLLPKTTCAPIAAAVRDPNPHVALLAIDLLGAACPASESPATALASLAEEAMTGGGWHRPAHAIVSLARVAPAQATPLLPRFVNDATWQVRMYAARAAGALGDVATLEKLGRDAHDNVREAALAELIASKRPEAVGIALDALTRSDYQLVMTAARALADPPDKPAAIAALQAASGRISAAGRDTARDALAAVADRLATLGVGATAASVADAASASARRSRLQVTDADLDALSRTRLRFSMAKRGDFELLLHADAAPITALHVARLAADGYYNGLTFHRVVPNFVIQGGSPGANEYAGQGPYMRDEVGLLTHARGTVGISTRGRDTGDAQIFINLVDLPRLDHTYTVFAEVVSGMEIVDAIVEGDVIEKVEVVRR
jgi:cyclophilin family peptidyl-prolyl cis-trans isomerase/HEAT repeat protein